MFRKLLLTIAASAAVVTVAGSPAEAVSSITPPSSLVCERHDNQVSVKPPRVWATSRTEYVIWRVQVQRWNGSAWYNYATYDLNAMWDTFGRNNSGWSGNRYDGLYMNFPVSHRGHYRIASGIAGAQGGTTYYGYAGGAGNYCYVY